MNVEQLRMIRIGFFCAFICTVLAQSTKFRPDGTCGIQNPIEECPGTTCKQWLYDEDNCMTCKCSPIEDLMHDVVQNPEAKSFITGRTRREANQEGGPYPYGVLWNTIKEDDKYLIPYTLNYDLTPYGVLVIKEVMSDIEKELCFRFIERTTERDYLFFFKGRGCYTQVGRRIGRNGISIGKICEYKPQVIHEIIHKLGFYHEHQRPDRDQYVKVLYDNIIKDKQRQYNIFWEWEPTVIPYDYRSIMHYYGSEYAVDPNKPTMTFANGSLITGKSRNKMSDLDVQKIAILYGCPGVENIITSEPFTFTKPTKKPVLEPGCCNIDLEQHCDYDKLIEFCKHPTFKRILPFCRRNCKVCTVPGSDN